MARKKKVYLTSAEQANALAANALGMFTQARDQLLEANQLHTHIIDGNKAIIESLEQEATDANLSRKANAAVIDRLNALVGL
jgi:hypothetical protein